MAILLFAITFFFLYTSYKKQIAGIITQWEHPANV